MKIKKIRTIAPKVVIVALATGGLIVSSFAALFPVRAVAVGNITVNIVVDALRDAGQNSGVYAGVVTSNVGGLNCSGASGVCSASLPYGSTITLTQSTNTPTTLFDFWMTSDYQRCSGGSVTGPSCTLTLPASGTSYTVNAHWKDRNYFYTGVSDGTNSGNYVTVEPGGNVCKQASCSYLYSSGITLQMQAYTVNADTELLNWGAATSCGANVTCSIVTGGSVSGASPKWDWKTYLVNLVFKGSGTGSVAATGGKSCTTNCTLSFARDAAVTFSATAANDSVFSGWGTRYDDSASGCLLTDGKAPLRTRNTSLTCQQTIWGSSTIRTITIVPYFDRKTSQSPSSGASSTTQTSTTQTSPPQAAPTATNEELTRVNQSNQQNATKLGITGLTLGGKTVYDKGAQLSFDQDDVIKLSGKAAPGSVVKLFIYSTPREAEVTADVDGNWSYLLSGLEPGDHHVEAQVFDKAKQTTSDRLTLVNFAILSLHQQNGVKRGVNPVYGIVAAGTGVLILTIGAVWLTWYRRKHGTLPQWLRVGRRSSSGQ